MGKFVLFYSCKRQCCVFDLSSFNSILKSYNLKRHYEQRHGEIDKLTVGERKAKLQSLKNNLTSQQYIFHKQTAQSNGIVSASFRVSHIIAKNMKAFYRRGVDSQMNITEELLELVSLKGTTTGRDIKDAVINCAQSCQIDLKSLVGIATDGALSMVGKMFVLLH
ncbi:hypothetical protein TNIN_318791 [Trichonephila inaurata madagascariensis]|uniref:DUF4371 domain-containing protein n=1 Tax=Trichonephila inaurata madagascariensis TaxID=2747483 RepID=A0A8X6XVF7_9ARAC|nr:hypothetical protein TNIN_318791 [Trichonephila inaurata madagascariensis]